MPAIDRNLAEELKLPALKFKEQFLRAMMSFTDENALEEVRDKLTPLILNQFASRPELFTFLASLVSDGCILPFNVGFHSWVGLPHMSEVAESKFAKSVAAFFSEAIDDEKMHYAASCYNFLTGATKLSEENIRLILPSVLRAVERSASKSYSPGLTYHLDLAGKDTTGYWKSVASEIRGEIPALRKAALLQNKNVWDCASTLFTDENDDLLSMIAELKNCSKPISYSAIVAGKRLRLYRDEIFELHKNSVDLRRIAATYRTNPDLRAERTVAELKRFVAEWRESGSGYNNFVAAAEKFGGDLVLNFLLNGDPRTQLLEHMPSVIKLSELAERKFGVSIKSFKANILTQVIQDFGLYRGLRSERELLRTARSDLESELDPRCLGPKIASQYSRLAEGEAFNSWNQLRSFAELRRLIRSARVNLDLQSSALPAEVRSFATGLLDDRAQRVDVGAVRNFLSAPRRFFYAADNILDNDDLQVLLPIAPTEGLSFANLRDALCDGRIDRATLMPEFAIEYLVPEKHFYRSTLDALRSALGDELNKPLAKNRKLLFHQVKRLLNQAGEATIEEYLSGKIVLGAALDKQILMAVFSPIFGIPDTCRKITARVHRKSDPLGARGGDDTDSCMPFGAGKTGVYLLNSACIFSSIQLDDGNQIRAVAQSIMTLDSPFTRKSDGVDSVDFFREEPSSSLKLSGDNIEVAPNFRVPYWESVIKAAYTDLFLSYREQLASIYPGLETIVTVGATTQDSVTFPRQVPVSSQPLIPLGYSDRKVNDYELPRVATGTFLSRNVIEASSRSIVHFENVGIRPLTIFDQMVIRLKLAGTPFVRDIEQIHRAHLLQHAFEQPNLSFVDYRQDGFLKGLLIALPSATDKTLVTIFSVHNFCREDGDARPALVETFWKEIDKYPERTNIKLGPRLTHSARLLFYPELKRRTGLAYDEDLKPPPAKIKLTNVSKGLI